MIMNGSQASACSLPSLPRPCRGTDSDLLPTSAADGADHTPVPDLLLLLRSGVVALVVALVVESPCCCPRPRRSRNPGLVEVGECLSVSSLVSRGLFRGLFFEGEACEVDFPACSEGPETGREELAKEVKTV